MMAPVADRLPRCTAAAAAVHSDKADWRRRMARQLRSIPPDAWQTAGRRVADRLSDLCAWRAARSLAVYLNTPTEVPTAFLIDEARQRGVAVYLPVYHPDRRAYLPAAWEPDSPLRPGPDGLLEPITPQWVDTVALDLVIVPGRAFTRDGWRLGRGGGHYDRFLAQAWARTALRIGLALECQLIEAALQEPHDALMHWIVTEHDVYGRSVGGAGCELENH